MPTGSSGVSRNRHQNKNTKSLGNGNGNGNGKMMVIDEQIDEKKKSAPQRQHLLLHRGIKGYAQIIFLLILIVAVIIFNVIPTTLDTVDNNGNNNYDYGTTGTKMNFDQSKSIDQHQLLKSKSSEQPIIISTDNKEDRRDEYAVVVDEAVTVAVEEASTNNAEEVKEASSPDEIVASNTNTNTYTNTSQAEREAHHENEHRDAIIRSISTEKGGVIDVMSNDSRCKLILSPSAYDKRNKKGQDESSRLDEPFSLGPCHYTYPTKTQPEKGWLKEIDWFFSRTVEPTSLKREECYVQCLTLLETLALKEEEEEKQPSMNIPKVTHELLAIAATMGLQDATRLLMTKHNLDPLYSPKNNFTTDTAGVENKNENNNNEFQKKIQPNAVQAAIMGGYAEIVKILTSSNMELVIDEHGRTVKDYVQMPGSPIRPYYAQTVLGITVPVNEKQEGQQQQSSPPVGTNTSDSGWNMDSVPFNDTSCDFDVIDTTTTDVSLDAFLKDYYLPGRPVVLRNHVSKDEMESFSKRAWSKLDHFHPTSQHPVGVTAYPNLTNQKKCSHKLTIEQLERDERCKEMKDLHMMHAEHDRGFDEVYAMYGGNPSTSSNSGGFRKLKEYFDFDKYGWQIFFGGDGSGATLHWHAAAFNILYVGKKEWRITPPQHRGFTGMTAQQAKAIIENQSHSMKCTQLPGDLIYIPDHWGHMTINHGFGIGVAAIVHANDRFVPGVKGKGKGKLDRDANTNNEPHSELLLQRKEAKARKMNRLAGDGNEQHSSIPFFFVHINKTGGTSLISMFSEHCTRDEYVRERWETDGGHNHRSFHSTAHSYLERHGRQVWDQAYTFAVVRHPLARQVSNFFFLVGMCEENKMKCEGDRNDRHIPTGKISSSSTEEEKINAFHNWMWNLYQAHPPGTPEHHLFGSKGHGNEEYSTMNATQTSWLVDETGQNIIVKKVLQLEKLSDEGMGELKQAIPCLAKAQSMVSKNQTPKYPHYSKFANNDRTNKIMQEVFAVDYVNFGYGSI